MINLIKRIYYFFKNYKKNKQFKKWQKAIYQGILDKNTEKAKLMKIIFNEIKKEKSRVQTSKYIPLTRRNKTEIKALIEVRHKKEMQFLDIKINNNLLFC